jgi:hypothetical protein
MTRRTSAQKGPSDAEVRALLDRYKCPTALHAVRTLFLGHIASPVLSASPMEVVKALWGGELPEFENLDAFNDLLGALVMGLWNRLTVHQKRSNPFRLLREDFSETAESLRRLVRVRREELDGFVDGLFGAHESLDLPERAHHALGVLAEIRSMFTGLEKLGENPAKLGSADEVRAMHIQVRDLTIIAEKEINAAVLSCTRARRQLLAVMMTTKPTLH